MLALYSRMQFHFDVYRMRVMVKGRWSVEILLGRVGPLRRTVVEL